MPLLPLSRDGAARLSRGSDTGSTGYVDPDPRIHWFTAMPPLGLFPCPDQRRLRIPFLREALPALTRRPCTPSSECLHIFTRPVSFESERCLPRVRSLFATSPSCVHSRARLPLPHHVPPTGFRSLSAVCSASRLAGLFHPAATSRVPRVQGLLSPCSLSSLVGKSCPHDVGRRMLTSRSQLPHPSTSPSRPCSTRRRVVGGPGLTGVLRSLPSSRFRPLQVLECRRVLRLPGAIRS